MVDAVVLAGGGLEKDRFPNLGPSIRRKAEIPILGRPMVEWVVSALRASPGVGRIELVGDASLDSPGLRALEARLRPEVGDIAGNLRVGLAALGCGDAPAERSLVLSGDLPLLTRAALEDLFTHAPRADVVFPYVERGDILSAFPGREWIFARTPDGDFTGSSAALLRREAVLERWAWVEQLLNARRLSPLRLALMIGPSLAGKYLLRRLRVVDAEKKLSTLLRLEGRGYRTRCPELAMDVDKASDIPLVERILREREGGMGG